MNSIAELAATLRHSPMFQLSLSSKELFHSNFLAWLAEEYPEFVATWLAGRLGIPATTIVRVRREAHNFDLLLFVDNEDTGSVVVLENKVKSLPEAPQLQAYTEKAHELYGKRVHFLLLSLSDPTSILAENNRWNVCRYAEYADVLKKVPARNDYHAALLNDYIFTIGQYCRIQELAVSISDDEPLLGSLTQFDPLRESRFDMFAVKVRYERVLQKICERLNISQSAALSTQKHVVGDARAYYGVSGSSRKPLLGIEVVIAAASDTEPMSIGVQVEGNQFRLFMAMERGGAALEEQARILLERNYWFSFRESSELQALERLWSGEAQTKDFCGYSQNGIKNFVYCYKPFSDTLSAEEIINAVVMYMRFAQYQFAQ